MEIITDLGDQCPRNVLNEIETKYENDPTSIFMTIFTLNFNSILNSRSTCKGMFKHIFLFVLQFNGYIEVQMFI